MAKGPTKVSVQLGPAPAQEFSDVEEYAIDSNILTLVDTATVKIADPGGARRFDFNVGDPAKVFMSDPRVSGGQQFQMMTGLIIGLDRVSDAQGGTIVNVTIADLGWHLMNNCGPLWKTLMGITWKKLIAVILDPSWGFSGVDIDNDFNRQIQQGLKVNNSRAAIAAANSSVDVFIPPVCFEAGDIIADKLITYARRAKYLVNVSADGWLQIFRPDYTTPARFTLHYHPLSDSNRSKNNVKGPSRIRESIDGLYTDIVCTWQVAIPTALPTRDNPHDGTNRSSISDSSVLPFKRLLTFSESDAMKQSMGDDRVRWKFQRGQFDSWTAEYTVEGHVMNSAFVAPDTVCSVDDTVNGYQGRAYVVARRFTRSATAGTLTQMQLRKPDLLRA